MFNPSRWLTLCGGLLLSLGFVATAQAAFSDPSGRVARLSHVEGDVSYSPAGEDEWLDVMRNRPLISGDRLWTEDDSRLELQVGSAAIRLGPETSFELLDLNDRIAQVQVTEGSINLRVRRLYRGQTIEVATPALAFTINRAGRYRIDVDPYDNQTTIVVWEGAGIAYGEGSNFPLRAGDTVRFFDSDLRDYEFYGLPEADDFDDYAFERDRRLDTSPSLRYLDDDVVGYADLDEYGRWRAVSNVGNVWFPTSVSRDWAPYRDGHWVWQEPWGWTWVDDAPWGFAPSHYGRWVSVSNRWGWIPGPRNVRATYAPALVAFVGGSNWSVSLSYGNSAPIGWFPLGPSDTYVPSYRASRDYFTRVNVNNTVINNTVITNTYNNYASGANIIAQKTYANRTIAGAVTAVPSDVFVNARPVRQAAMNIDYRAMTTGEVRRAAPVAPSMRSVLGVGKASDDRPSRAALERQVMARNAPPPEERPFATRERELKSNPGLPPQSRGVEKSRGKSQDAAQHIRIITDQRATVNAREAGSTRDDDAPKSNTMNAPKNRPALDRNAPDNNGRGRGQSDRANGNDRSAPAAQMPDPAGEAQAAQQARAAAQQQQQQQQQADRQREADSRNQQKDQQRARQTEQLEQQAKHQRDVQAQQAQQTLEQNQARDRAQMQRQQASEQQAAEQAAQAAREREALAPTPSGDAEPAERSNRPDRSDRKNPREGSVANADEAASDADEEAEEDDKSDKGKNKGKDKDDDQRLR